MQCHFFWSVPQVVRLTLVMYSTYIKDFLKGLRTFLMSLVVVQLQLCQLSKHRQVMFLPIFQQMLFPLQTDRFSLKVTCSTQVCDLLLMLVFQYPELVALPRQRL